MWKGFQEATVVSSATSDSDKRRLAKRVRVVSLTASRSAFLKLQLDAAVKQVEEHLSDKYKR
jgi:hypothetical protein